MKDYTPIRDFVKEYLPLALGISIAWDSRTIEQKDRRRRELHNKIAEALGLSDRDIIGRCTDAAYAEYLKSKNLDTAKSAFYHTLRILTDDNPLTPEEEKELVDIAENLKGYDRTKDNFNRYCMGERQEEFKRMIAELEKEYSKKTPEELYEMLCAVPDNYYELCRRLDECSHVWFVWHNEIPNGGENGFGCIYYDMTAYYGIHNFYHDRTRNVGFFKDGKRKWDGNDERKVKWAIHSLAVIHILFANVEEYLNTPWVDLVKKYIGLGYRKKEESDGQG